MIVKHLGFTAIDNKAPYKCLIHSFKKDVFYNNTFVVILNTFCVDFVLKKVQHKVELKVMIKCVSFK